MCLAQETYHQPCKHRYPKPFEYCRPMRKRLQGTAHPLGSECPNHNTIIVETVDACRDCIEQMKITASLGLAENITGTDETAGKRKKKKGKDRDSVSGKNDGHLVVPVWDTKGVSTAK